MAALLPTGVLRAQTKDERSVSLEIFEMASPESAFGIFSIKRSKEGAMTGIGRVDSLGVYYMNFWRAASS
jgi:hypothetical protein